MVAILNGNCYVMEFKVNEMTPEDKALVQLKERRYHEKYVGYESTHLHSGNVQNIYLMGIEFSKTDRNITAYDWEKVEK
ncbi:MAG: PD-(D/E)XK nuclease domain-containing protein [Leptospiraceae bacterium]|nr:PD-(D/E)XK nuclease domain-containing protein [Leptospiraceae bacterium]MCP5501874.1 PD-(D/E)XK nuclease domain-containing protein [Leptospiraceae bacterium]